MDIIYCIDGTRLNAKLVTHWNTGGSTFKKEVVKVSQGQNEFLLGQLWYGPTDKGEGIGQEIAVKVMTAFLESFDAFMRNPYSYSGKFDAKGELELLISDLLTENQRGQLSDK